MGIGWSGNPDAVTQADPPWEVDQANPPWIVEKSAADWPVTQGTSPWVVDQLNTWEVDQVDTWEVEQVLDLNVDLILSPAPWSFQTTFGQRFGIPSTTTADIWTGTALTRPLPLAPKAMSIVSTSASDAVATVLGAQFVGITFIDSAGDWRTSDLLGLNGVTPVPITYKPGQILVTQGGQPTPPDGSSVAASIFRIQDVAVFVAAGATEAAPRVNNIGTLAVRDTATGLITYENVPIGIGRSQAAAFHCPRNYVGRLTKVHLGTARGSGRIDIATTFGLGTAFQRVPLISLNDSSFTFLNDPATTPITARSDLQAVVVTTSNNIDVSAILQIRLKPA